MAIRHQLEGSITSTGQIIEYIWAKNKRRLTGILCSSDSNTIFDRTNQMKTLTYNENTSHRKRKTHQVREIPASPGKFRLLPRILTKLKSIIFFFGQLSNYSNDDNLQTGASEVAPMKRKYNSASLGCTNLYYL